MTTTPTDNLTFEALYAKYWKRFVEIADFYIRDRMVAEDIVTDNFVGYWLRREELACRSVPAWLLAAIKHDCMDHLRSARQHADARREIRSTADRLSRQYLASLEANEPRAMFMAEISAIIEAELDRMSELRRRVFVAHRYDEMSYKEIARIYALSEGQVQGEIRAARQALKVALKDYAPALLLLLLH